MSDIFGIPIDALTWFMPVLIIFVILFTDIKDAKKALVLFYKTKNQGDFMDLPVKNGIIQIKENKYYADETDVTLVPSGILLKSLRPLYVIKWDRVLPHKFTEKGLQMMSAENLTNFIENKTLTQLLTPKDAGKMTIVFLIVGVVMGALLMHTLVSSGYIKIGG